MLDLPRYTLLFHSDLSLRYCAPLEYTNCFVYSDASSDAEALTAGDETDDALVVERRARALPTANEPLLIRGSKPCDYQLVKKAGSYKTPAAMTFFENYSKVIQTKGACLQRPR